MEEDAEKASEGGILVANLLGLGSEKLALAAEVLQEMGGGARDAHEEAARDVGAALAPVAEFLREAGK